LKIHVFDKMPPEPTRKPREKPKPYQRKPKVPVPKDAPKTSAARAVKEKKHENLTLHDWMTVFAFIDQHPGMTQGLRSYSATIFLTAPNHH
jgi:hypothetical protein